MEYGLFYCVIKILQNHFCNHLLSSLMSATFFNRIKPAGPVFIDYGNSAKGPTLDDWAFHAGDRDVYIVQIGSFCASKQSLSAFTFLSTGHNQCWHSLL